MAATTHQYGEYTVDDGTVGGVRCLTIYKSTGLAPVCTLWLSKEDMLIRQGARLNDALVVALVDLSTSLTALGASRGQQETALLRLVKTWGRLDTCLHVSYARTITRAQQAFITEHAPIARRGWGHHDASPSR